MASAVATIPPITASSCQAATNDREPARAVRRRQRRGVGAGMAAIDGGVAPQRATDPDEVDDEIVEPAEQKADRRQHRQFARDHPDRIEPAHVHSPLWTSD